jgi:hypothetical protein
MHDGSEARIAIISDPDVREIQSSGGEQNRSQKTFTCFLPPTLNSAAPLRDCSITSGTRLG